MCHTHLIQLPWEEGGVYVPRPPDPALCDVEVPAGTAPLSGERDHTLRNMQIITTRLITKKIIDQFCPINLF
jgi:hypothetical protein